jgi:hypothetical protein
MVYSNRLVCNTLNFLAAWAIVIPYMSAVIHVIVIHNGGLADVGIIIIRASPVVYTIGLVHIFRTNKYPPALRALPGEANAGP